MKPISHQILKQYFDCPKRIYYQSISQTELINSTIFSKKNLQYYDFYSSIINSLKTFFLTPPLSRNLELLISVLRKNWAFENYESQESERQYGLEAIALLKNFFRNFEITKTFTIIEKKGYYKINELSFELTINFCDFEKNNKLLEITEFSLRPQKKNMVLRKIDDLQIFDFNLIAKILYAFQNFDIEKFVYKIHYIRLNEQDTFIFQKNDYLLLLKFCEKLVTDYYNSDFTRSAITNNSVRCKYCEYYSNCYLTGDFSNLEKNEIIKFYNFIVELLELNIHPEALENFIQKKIAYILPEVENIKIIDSQLPQPQPIVDTDFFRVFYYIENSQVNYYTPITEIENGLRYFCFSTITPLSEIKLHNLELLLKYVKLKYEQSKLYEQSIKDKMTE